MLPFIFLVIGVLAQQTFADEPEAIVGGQRAVLGEFPHQCSLNVNGQHMCGCSILNANTILTAAHCVQGIVSAPYNNFKVVTGTVEATRGQFHNVARVIVHPQYSPGAQYAWNNDVAIIKLSSPMQFNQNQRPIAITDSPATPGQQCTLSGWGMIKANGPLAPYLLKMPQSIISTNQCQQRHGLTLTNSHLCAYERRGIGACQGDSGGPLICNGKQYGITSWVLPCAVGEPDAYTNCYYHRNFIRQYM